MNPLISIIVPVYNTEKFIDECIQSVLIQTYEEWELLLIDDGSTDKSFFICDKYSSLDNRIKVIHKKNSGVSDSRNKGIDIARGEYIIFLDSDDYWLDNSILQVLVEKAIEFDLHIVRGDYKNVDTDGDEINVSPYLKERVSSSILLLDYLSFLSKIIKGEYFLVLCLIKRNVINDIRFNTKRIFLEDAEFFIRLIQQGLKCMYLPICFYAYRKHNNAVTIKNHPQKFFDALDFSRFCFDSVNNKAYSEQQILFVVEEGISNYLFDIKVISETKRTYKEYCDIIYKYKLRSLHQYTIEVARIYPIQVKYYLCFLPLTILIYYYRLQFELKRNLRKLINKMLK